MRIEREQKRVEKNRRRQRRGFEGTEKKGKRKGKKYLWISFAPTVYRASYNSDARTNFFMLRKLSPLFLSLQVSCLCKS